MSLGPSSKSLHYLTEVLAKGSIRAAAQVCNVEPSVVSRQIARLEAELGVKLLERRGRGIVRTEAAGIVLAYCRERTAGLRGLRATLDELAGCGHGSVHISAGDGFIESLLEMVLRPFCTAHPGIQIVMTAASADITVQAISENRCDVGVALSAPASEAVRIVAYGEHPIRLVCSPRHHMAARQGPIPLQDLCGEVMALALPHTGVGTLIRRAGDAEGIELVPRFLANTTASLKQYAATELGITFLPECAVFRELTEGRLVARQTTSTILEACTAQLMVRAGRIQSPAVERFLHVFKIKRYFVRTSATSTNTPAAGSPASPHDQGRPRA